VVIYFDQISSDADTCFSLIVRPAFEVNDVKDSNIKIYDYYQPEHSKSISYHLPSGKFSKYFNLRLNFFI
jgi:hypothetical protein